MKFFVSAKSFYFFEEGDTIVNYFPSLKKYLKGFRGDYAIVEIPTLEDLAKLQQELRNPITIVGNELTIDD